jgi:hypothetical protein
MSEVSSLDIVRLINETYIDTLATVEQVERRGGEWVVEMVDEMLRKRVARMIEQIMTEPPKNAKWMAFQVGGELVRDPETGQVIKVAMNDVWNWDIAMKMLPLCKPNGIGKLVEIGGEKS